MVVRELLSKVDEINVIARAIFEDAWKEKDEIERWITKYYAQLQKLRSAKIKKSNTMLFFRVMKSLGKIYGAVSGFDYEDIKKNEEIYYAIEYLSPRQYASLFVANAMTKKYGEEVVAAEILREYGWNTFDEAIVCPDTTRKAILSALENMESRLFLSTAKENREYCEKCRREFVLYYEGKSTYKTGKKTRNYINLNFKHEICFANRKIRCTTSN